MLTEKDHNYLKMTIELAKASLEKGDEPFGSILVLDDKILYEGHNEVSSGDNTRHPEFEIARWAANNLSPEERKRAVVYTSNEHCPMCASAHGWVGLGKIIYACSGKQLKDWLKEWKMPSSPVNYYPIKEIISTNIEIIGPIKEYEEEIKNLHYHSIFKKGK